MSSETKYDEGTRTSLPTAFICLLGRVGGANSTFHPLIMRSPDRMHQGRCWATSAAHHSLELLPELLVEQSIHDRVDGGIEQDHGGTCVPR